MISYNCQDQLTFRRALEPDLSADDVYFGLVPGLVSAKGDCRVVQVVLYLYPSVPVLPAVRDHQHSYV